MAKFIFLISIVIIALCPSCYLCDKFDKMASIELPVTNCTFGPFKETATKCLKINNWKFTGCIMQDFDWFHINDTLHADTILKTFSSYIKGEKYLKKVKNFITLCIKRGNLQGPNKRNETADEFIKCLNEKNAFADLFPKAFCAEESDNNSDEYEYDDDETTETNDFTYCEFGPFKSNAERCSAKSRNYARCLLSHLGYFKADNKINLMKLLTSIPQYTVNKKYAEEVIKVMIKCVNKANAVNGGKKRIASALMKCWYLENAISIFRSAFCPISNETI